MNYKYVYYTLLENKALTTIFFLLATSLAPFLDEQSKMNWLLVGAMSFSPFWLLRYWHSSKIEMFIWSFLAFFVMQGLGIHFAINRWTTIAYSGAYLIFFVVFIRVLEYQKPSLDYFEVLLKTIIVAYCLVLMVLQFCVVFGLPIFNVSNYSPSDPFKLNSLMSEPSHSARVIPICMYVLVSVQEIMRGKKTFVASFKENQLVWLTFLYGCITMMSSTAYLFMLFVFAKFLDKRRVLQFVLGVVIVASILHFVGINKEMQRTVNFSLATLSLDENEILKADHSAAQRIVPSIIGFKSIGLSSLEDFFGHGVDADSQELRAPIGNPNASAGAFTLWYNYGFFVQIFFWLLTFYICYDSDNKISILVWGMCIWIYGGINNQIIWLTLSLFYMFKYLKSMYESNSYCSWES